MPPDVLVRTAGNVDAAGISGQIVDRDVVLDQIVVGVHQFDAVVAAVRTFLRNVLPFAPSSMMSLS